MNSYKALNLQEFTVENFSIVPIRFEDRMDILKWRNEQILLKTISFVDGVKNGVSRVIDLETGKIIKEKSFDDKPISEELVKGTIKFEKI